MSSWLSACLKKKKSKQQKSNFYLSMDSEFFMMLNNSFILFHSLSKPKSQIHKETELNCFSPTSKYPGVGTWYSNLDATWETHIQYQVPCSKFQFPLSQSSFLLVCKAAPVGSNTQVSIPHIGDPDGILNSWFQLGKALAVLVTGE